LTPKKSNKLDWYSREMLEDAVARTYLELLDFIFNKKPNEFNFRVVSKVPH
jgi:hypothetical protein